MMNIFTEKQTEVKSMTDLDMLYDFRISTNLAAASYMAMAMKAHDETLQRKFVDLANQAKSADLEIKRLITEYGGKT